MSLAHDVQALRDLAGRWREVSARNRYDRDRPLRDDDPGPHMTAIQFEWAAREIERLRAAMRHVISDSPGTPDSVKKYLVRELEGAWGEGYEQSILATWDHAKHLQDRLGEARRKLAWVETSLRNGATNGESEVIRAWCSLTLEAFFDA